MALEQSQVVLHLFVYNDCSADVFLGLWTSAYKKMKRFYKSCKASNIYLKELKYSKAKHYEIHESERKSNPKIQPNHRLLKLQQNQHFSPQLVVQT